MNASTPLFFYVLYASPFVVAAVVLAVSKFTAWRESKTAEVIEKPIMTPDDPMVEEVRSAPIRRHYMSYASTY